MLKIKTILEQMDYEEFIGNTETDILSPVQSNPDKVNDGNIMWVSDKNKNILESIIKGTIICSKDAYSSIGKSKTSCNYIISNTPRLLFTQILLNYFQKKIIHTVSKTASIHQSSIIGENVFIGDFVVIEENCLIGSNSIIGSNTVIKYDTQIGNEVIIGSNNTIGGIGFGYEKDLDSGAYIQIPHLGNVIIKDKAEIGNNTCIDRAVMGSTIIEENAKIDNLVHIAHGVVIGKNSLIIANAMIAGSVMIGENVWVAPSVSILNGKSVDDDAVIGMGAVVLKNVEKKQTIIGNPGKPLVKK